jgi:hypothetical protein
MKKLILSLDERATGFEDKHFKGQLFMLASGCFVVLVIVDTVILSLNRNIRLENLKYFCSVAYLVFIPPAVYYWRSWINIGISWRGLEGNNEYLEHSHFNPFWMKAMWISVVSSGGIIIFISIIIAFV